MFKYLIFFIGVGTFSIDTSAQQLQPGFDKDEFIELLKIGARTSTDSAYYNKLPAPQRSTLIYQSANVGFEHPKIISSCP